MEQEVRFPVCLVCDHLEGDFIGFCCYVRVFFVSISLYWGWGALVCGGGAASDPGGGVVVVGRRGATLGLGSVLECVDLVCEQAHHVDHRSNCRGLDADVDGQCFDFPLPVLGAVVAITG